MTCGLVQASSAYAQMAGCKTDFLCTLYWGPLGTARAKPHSRQSGPATVRCYKAAYCLAL